MAGGLGSARTVRADCAAGYGFYFGYFTYAGDASQP